MSTLPERAKEALEAVERIEADMREFDGEKRGMAAISTLRAKSSPSVPALLTPKP